jgi:DnaJ-class molecular chaperone
MVETLVKGIEKNKLATYFHREEGTLCQGCHHNSPADKKPPRCGSCHGRPFDANAVLRPGMKGAYHQQCIGCHQEMGLEKPKATDCAGCHKEKKKQN